MKSGRIVQVAVAAGLVAMAQAMMTPGMAAQATPQLTAVLAKMDAASRSFHNAQAEFKWDYYQKIVHDTTTDTGAIYFQREGGAMDMGAVLNDPTGKTKASKVLAYKDGLLKMFTPGIDQLDVVKAGANQAEYESFLTLGFGGSGSELAKNWTIHDLGPVTLNDDGKGVVTEELDLIGKDAASRKNFSHVTIWVDPTRGVSLKQMFFTPSGDYRTATYTHIRVNSGLDKSRYAMKTDKKTQVFNH